MRPAASDGRCGPLSAPGAAGAAALVALLGWQFGAIGIGISVIAALLGLHLARRVPLKAGSDCELRAHLARARRRDERTDLLVARLHTSSLTDAHRLKAGLRLTDSGCIVADRGKLELHVMVDRERLDRHTLAQRLRSLATDPIEIGWSQFPEEGFTLPALIQAARQSCCPAMERDADPLPLPTTPAVAPEVAS
jgi:hypothetical protein